MPIYKKLTVGVAGEVSWSVRGGWPALLGFYWLLVDSTCDSTSQQTGGDADAWIRGGSNTFCSCSWPMPSLGLGDVGRMRQRTSAGRYGSSDCRGVTVLFNVAAHHAKSNRSKMTDTQEKIMVEDNCIKTSLRVRLPLYSTFMIA